MRELMGLHPHPSPLQAGPPSPDEAGEGRDHFRVSWLFQQVFTRECIYYGISSILYVLIIFAFGPNVWPTEQYLV